MFISHRTVNPDDVENAAWHFLCVARAESPEAARKQMLPVGPDARLPMREVYQMFQGRMTQAQVMKAAGVGSLGAVLCAALHRPLSRSDRRSRAGRAQIEIAAEDRYRARRRLHARCRARAHADAIIAARSADASSSCRRRPRVAQRPPASRSRIASTSSRRRRRSCAAYGPHDIGVRTIQVTDKNRPDILNIKEGGPIGRYDRTLTLEVWYPATLAAGPEARRRVSRHHARSRGDGDALRQGGARCAPSQKSGQPHFRS